MPRSLCFAGLQDIRSVEVDRCCRYVPGPENSPAPEPYEPNATMNCSPRSADSGGELAAGADRLLPYSTPRYVVEVNRNSRGAASAGAPNSAA